MNQFSPDWISPPRDTVIDILYEKKVSYNEFLQQMHYTLQPDFFTDNNFIITENIARNLEHVLGSSKEFWINRDKQYHSALSKL